MTITAKNRFVRLICMLLIALFLYTGFIKLWNLQRFQEDMWQSPLIPHALIKFIAVALPLAEIVFALMLLYSCFRRAALYLCSLLMLAFSLYLISLYIFFEKPPCACGGILGKVSYPIHIGFNIAVTLAAFAAWYTSFSAKIINSNRTTLKRIQ